jgi:hypothetical protein
LSKESYLLDAGFDAYPMCPELVAYLAENTDIEVNWVPNTGPYRKLLPLLERCWGQDQLILTIDDDTEILDINRIKLYVDEYNTYNARICSSGIFLNTQTKEVKYNNQSYQGYMSFDLMAEGYSCVLYNARWFTDKRVLDSILYNEVCRTEDDLWFHMWTRMSNIQTRVLYFLNHVIQPVNSLFIKLNRSGRDTNIPTSIYLLQDKYGLLLDIQTEQPIRYIKLMPTKSTGMLSTRIMGA